MAYDKKRWTFLLFEKRLSTPLKKYATHTTNLKFMDTDLGEEGSKDIFQNAPHTFMMENNYNVLDVKTNN